jgi:L-aspartate semialdehyde sulfurtransferase ferredoxin
MEHTADELQHLRLNLTFPSERVNEPILADVIKKFDVVADIRRAEVEANIGGYIMLELTGTEQQLDKSIAYMKSLGVGVGFIGSDEVQAY